MASSRSAVYSRQFSVSPPGMPWLSKNTGVCRQVLFSRPAALSHASALLAADGPGRRPADEGHGARRPRGTATGAWCVIAGCELHRRRSRSTEHVLWQPRARPRAALRAGCDSPSKYGRLGVLRAVAAALAGRCRSRLVRPEVSKTVRPRGSRSPRERHLRVRQSGERRAASTSTSRHTLLRRTARATGLVTVEQQSRSSSTSCPDAVDRRKSRASGSRAASTGTSPTASRSSSSLDGRLFHDSTSARDQDFDRDLLAQVERSAHDPARLGQVFDRPCWTAGQVGILLQQRGWSGRSHARVAQTARLTWLIARTW